MTANYWVAKYVEDPVRNEPRNIGVFVQNHTDVCARFIGERDDGVFDGRRVRGNFLYPQVYAQWREYWRESISERSLKDIASVVTPNFYVIAGGEVSDTGSDDAEEICAFVYSLLVSEGPSEAYQWIAEASIEAALASDVTSAFAEWRLLDDMPGQTIPHPVVKDQNVIGTHVAHKPSFSQRNGKLYVMEHIDFGYVKQKPIKERAGWMAYMFMDIKEKEPECESYSIVRPERDVASETVAYARSVLGSVSRIVNWADEDERLRFLEERRLVALSFA